MKVDIILGRAFLALMSIIATFLLLEFGSRYFLPDSTLADRKNLSETTDVYRQPKPYVMFGGKGGGKYHNDERFNINGYRGRAPEKEKKRSEFRIFLLGGSTVVFGEPTLSILLEQRFKKDGYKNITVFNYGVISSVSGTELSRIIYEIADYKPDLIIMYSGGNDLLDPPYFDPRPGYPYNFMIYDSNPLLESNVKTYPTFLMTAYGSNLLRRMFPNFFIDHLVPLDRLRKEVKYGSQEWEDKIVSCYVSNITKASIISEAFGAQFVAFFQPIIYYKNNLTVEEAKWPGTEYEDYKYMRDKINKEIENFRKVKKINFFDVSNVFTERVDAVFIDRIHITQEANSVVASELYRHVKQLIRVK